MRMRTNKTRRGCFSLLSSSRDDALFNPILFLSVATFARVVFVVLVLAEAMIEDIGEVEMIPRPFLAWSMREKICVVRRNGEDALEKVMPIFETNEEEKNDFSHIPSLHSMLALCYSNNDRGLPCDKRGEESDDGYSSCANICTNETDVADTRLRTESIKLKPKEHLYVNSSEVISAFSLLRRIHFLYLWVRTVVLRLRSCLRRLCEAQTRRPDTRRCGLWKIVLKTTLQTAGRRLQWTRGNCAMRGLAYRRDSAFGTDRSTLWTEQRMPRLSWKRTCNVNSTRSLLRKR